MEGRQYDIFNYTDGFNIRPKKFEVRLTARSERHREMLEREVKGADAFMAKYTTFENRKQ